MMTRIRILLEVVLGTITTTGVLLFIYCYCCSPRTTTTAYLMIVQLYCNILQYIGIVLMGGT